MNSSGSSIVQIECGDDSFMLFNCTQYIVDITNLEFTACDENQVQNVGKTQL